jgi:IS5 family transposase
VLLPSLPHDSQEFDKLPDCGRAKDKLKTCGEVYADSAYANKTNDRKLGKKNNKVLHRAYRNTSLMQVQKQENKQCSSLSDFFSLISLFLAFFTHWM